MSSLDENPNCERTHATFRLMGDALRPDEISAALGLEPTRAMAKDQEIPVGRKGKTTRRQGIGVWLLDSADVVDSTSLERHLVHLLEAIEPVAGLLAAIRLEHDLRADLFCYWLSRSGHGGPLFSPEVLSRIAALDLVLGIDVYGPFGGRAERPTPAG